MSHPLGTIQLVILLLSLVPIGTSAQFLAPLVYGGAGNENGRALLAAPDGGFFVAGNYDASYTPQEVELPVYGEEDLFLGRLDADGRWQWISGMGSFLEDKIAALRPTPDGGLLLVGSFWLEMTYEDLLLQSSDNIKGIFILRLDSQGEWLWAKVINGADLKEVNDVQIADNGDIFLTGHFAEALQFDGLSLEAAGRNDAYLLHLDPTGALVAAQQLGYRGLTRGQTIALHPDGGYYWGGVYDDTLYIDTTVLLANTFDRDVFLVRYSAQGEPLWARRAGGVFEEELIAMATNPAGELLATGFLIGVMSLSDELSIQSRNGNPDIFLFKYDETGKAIWARSIGGDLIDLPSALCLLDEQLIIGGTYQGQIAWDAFSTPFTTGVNGFVAGFDARNGAGKWLAPVTTDQFAFVESLALNARRELLVLGSWQGTAQLGDFAIGNSQTYDFFLTGIAPAVTPVAAVPSSARIQVFPNPVRERVYIKGLPAGLVDARLYDLSGRMVRRVFIREETGEIEVRGLPAGVYSLLLQREQWREMLRVVVQ